MNCSKNDTDKIKLCKVQYIYIPQLIHETASYLVAENRWSLSKVGTGRKRACMAQPSQRSLALTPNFGRGDSQPRRVLFLEVN